MFCSDPGKTEHLDFQKVHDKYLTKFLDKKLLHQIAAGRKETQLRAEKHRASNRLAVLSMAKC